MAQVLRILFLFTIIGAYTCMALKEMPIPATGDAKRMRRSPESNWPGVYPQSITTIGGVYASRANGIYTADGTYNDRPIYKNGTVAGQSTSRPQAMQLTNGCWTSMM